MAAPSFHNVFVGAETGLLKGVHAEKSAWNNLTTVLSSSREQEITAMCWTNAEQTELCFGRRNRSVLTYDVESGTPQDLFQITSGSGSIRGLAKQDDSYITCVESGHLQLWRDGQSQVTIEAGENIYCMRQNPTEPHLVATGGKENDLKLWDLGHPEEAVFKAKNVRNDWLNLRVPLWVTDIGFLEDSRKVVTGTGHHQVRVYDPNASQRRPVLDFTFDEYPITCLSLRPGGSQVVVGNTQGNMALLDIRKGAEVHRFRGFAGAIRCVQCHPSLPLVASCGLDRFLRVHDLETKQLQHKVYLKSRLNCLLMSDVWTEESEDSTEVRTSPAVVDDAAQSEDSGNESQEDELWGRLAVVKTKKKQRRPKHDDDVEDLDNIMKPKKRKAVADQGSKLDKKHKKIESEKKNEDPHAGESMKKKKKKKSKKKKQAHVPE